MFCVVINELSLSHLENPLSLDYDELLVHGDDDDVVKLVRCYGNVGVVAESVDARLMMMLLRQHWTLYA